MQEGKLTANSGVSVRGQIIFYVNPIVNMT